MTRRSRRVGKGSITSYATKSGTRWRYQLWVPMDPDAPEEGDRQTGKAGFLTADDADAALHDARTQLKNRIRFATGVPTIGECAATWLDGLQLEASTVAGYRRLVRNHITPYLGHIELGALTSTRITKHYNNFRASGRRDDAHAGEPLSANSVNTVHVCLGAMLDAAKDDGYIVANPVRKRRVVKAPTGQQIKSERPEVVTWTAEQLGRFLAWDRDVFDDELYSLWHTVAFTGCRRSEALALQWRDIDAANHRLSVRRALDTTARNVVKLTKTGGARPIDLDAGTVEALTSWRVVRAGLSLELAKPSAFVFGNLQGEARSPYEISRRWRLRVAKAQESLGADTVPTIKLHDLRHTHATLLLKSGVHPKVVQERLGHSTIATTMNIYSHVTPTMQRAASERFATLLGSGWSGAAS